MNDDIRYIINRQLVDEIVMFIGGAGFSDEDAHRIQQALDARKLDDEK